MLERLSCGASFRNVKICDLDFADDAVIFAETLDILLGAIKLLIEESEPLGLRVSWVKTKIQAFNDIFDAAINCLDSDNHVSAGCEPEVNKHLGQSWIVIDSLDHGVWCCRYLCRRMKVRVFKFLVLAVLLYRCETWTLTRDLRLRLNFFGTRSL